ncbi:MAG: acriflavine resistance protein B [Bacteroidetes bacterium GWF2_43_63]|nr:MAG: acriflavine resistance protein B [Bacteroidetes bacterium GWE2_42_42]OFY52648.1 MAG: acriflavine resistance protein B [Bacteroidetes bacterium GWF2_43_63]HBG69923.1 CusA/CzcA family heavy metal efflux RND transporter [Bacteroidales bacterium]HCB62651.1 CusA/CzcA family heavy metal efflux RND transporter [Bacteroidales bacterium]HCY23771.1 CusA/CzcA family heavy metal efflux RND transporter [Bacteroidales bacterium]
MIDRIIRFSINNKLIIGLFVVALVAWGIFSLKKLPIDAVPDITNNQVQIISIAPTLAANEVEQFITAPIEVSVANIPNQVELRSISRLGLSVVTVVFKDNVDMYWARQQISERLKEAEELIPEGVTTPQMAPISTGLSEIYQYVLKVKPGYEKMYDPMQLRTIQDWIVRREMLGTPGVADVNSYGGFMQQYEVSVNPDQLKSMNITLDDIFEALEQNNQNTGSAYIDKKPQAYFIRGIGLVTSIEDIENIVVKTTDNNIPVLIKDVANVQMGSAPRYGAFIVDTIGEAVGGVVMMLKGKNASEVIDGVKERIELIEKSLPEGLEIYAFYDRTELVDRAVGTVSRNLIEGGLIVIFILVLMLGNLRAGLIVASVIPLSMLFAISLMNLFGVSGNLMSLGAIDFGLIVDGAVIIVESVVHRITQSKSHHLGVAKLSQQQMDTEVYGSSKRMMNSATFGQIIILIVYLPILTLVGIEGKMFRPMAETVSFAILGALILSLTYVPVASALFLSKKTVHKTNLSDRLMNFLHKIFDPLLNFSLKHKIAVVSVSAGLFIGSIFLFNSLGGEFIPTLEEGDLAAGVMTLQGGSLSNTIEMVEKANKILMEKFPEVEHVVCKIGTGEIPTDPTPMETGDYIIVMKDKDEWTSASSREEMMEKMQEELSVLKGVVFTLQQPIQMRFNELMTGSKQDVAVKIFGDNLDTLSAKGEELEILIRDIEGVEDVNVEKVTGSGQVQVNYNRKKIAQYGLNIEQINSLLKTAFAGSSAGVVYDEEKRFDLVVRFNKDFRDDIEFVRNLYIPLPNGNQITLEQVADVEMKTGTAQISRESTKRRITVQFNVRNRDVQSIIEEIRAVLDDKLSLPPGYYITYGGQFENLVNANKRLAVAVPVALILIFILLFFTFRSLKQTLLVYSAVPLSMIGGVFALFIRDMNFSISAGIGFIALFGVAVLNGIVLIAEFNRLEKEDGITDIYDRVRKGIKARFRPVLMTAAVASMGFLPMALSTSAGAEVQKPLATVVIGGLITATLLTLVVLPVLYILFSSKRKPKKVSPPKISIVLVLAAGLNILTLSESNAQNTKSFTLDQVVQASITNNGLIKSANLNVEYQKKLKAASWQYEKTGFEYSYGQTNSFIKDNGFSVSQNFPSIFQNVGRSKLADAYVKSAEYNVSYSETEVVSAVKSYYFQLLYNYSLLNLLNYQDRLYTDFLKAATLKNATGETPLLEKVTAETRLFEIKTLIKQVMADILINKQKLQVLMKEPNPVEIVDTALYEIDFSFVLDSSAIIANPGLAIMKQQIEISRRETQIEKLAFLPDLSVGYFNQTNKDLDNAYRFTGVQVGVSIPLLFFSQSAKVEAGKINQMISQNNYEYYLTTLKGEFNALIQEYLKLKTSLDYYESYANKQSELIIEQSKRSYMAGSIDYVEYVLNLDEALEIKSNYLLTLSLYNESIIAIEKLMGNAQ